MINSRKLLESNDKRGLRMFRHLDLGRSFVIRHLSFGIPSVCVYSRGFAGKTCSSPRTFACHAKALAKAGVHSWLGRVLT
jgi:hypothetical protein